MPAHKKLVVGGEDAAIEYFERRLEQRRPGALQNHPPLLREGRRYRGGAVAYRGGGVAYRRGGVACRRY